MKGMVWLMASITDYILPVLVAFIAVYGALKGVKVFEVFVSGAKNGIKTAVGILAPLVGLMFAVQMLRSSGAMEVLCFIMSPIAKLTGIPEQVMPLTILSPISGM